MYYQSMEAQVSLLAYTVSMLMKTQTKIKICIPDGYANMGVLKRLLSICHKYQNLMSWPIQ